MMVCGLSRKDVAFRPAGKAVERTDSAGRSRESFVIHIEIVAYGSRRFEARDGGD